MPLVSSNNSPDRAQKVVLAASWMVCCKDAPVDERAEKAVVLVDAIAVACDCSVELTNPICVLTVLIWAVTVLRVLFTASVRIMSAAIEVESDVLRADITVVMVEICAACVDSWIACRPI